MPSGDEDLSKGGFPPPPLVLPGPHPLALPVGQVAVGGGRDLLLADRDADRWGKRCVLQGGCLLCGHSLSVPPSMGEHELSHAVPQPTPDLISHVVPWFDAAALSRPD